MFDHFLSSLRSSQYMPHGNCYLWQTPLVSLHVISDAIIAIAYFSIPVVLIYFVHKRKHDFSVRLLVLFGLFIMLCGIGHIFDIVTLWYPVYWSSGAVRAATSIVSAYTAFEVATLLPHFLSLKDPKILEAVNQQLEKTIAEKIATAKELEESQNTFRCAFSDAPIGMALVSVEGCFLKTNKAISGILGYSKEELLSTDFQSITHPDDLQEDLDLVEDLMAGRRRFYQLEKRYIHKLGHFVPAQLSVALLRDSENEPLYFITHVQDISQQKQATASLLAESKASEAASQAKSSFLAAMSHEIRTPMNAMLGMTELLADTKLDGQQKDFVEVINKSGNTLLTVINDILDFSKIESNKLELEMGRLDLYECTEDVIALFSNQAEQKGISLTSLIEPASTPHLFKGDSIRLRQIMSNLVSNSIKFTETGEVSIYIRVEPPAKEIFKGDSNKFFTIHFSVKDTGIGISEDKRSHLFESFSQVDTSTTRRYGGTGLGLAISKRLVEMMNGEISVKSKVGVGSVFYFAVQLEAYDCATQEKIDKKQVSLGHKRLLVVDSNETSGRYLQLQAESWGLEICVASSAEAALVQLFRSDPFDAIAIDELLVDMDNVQLALQIRNFPNYQAVPIILLQSRRTKAQKALKMMSNKVRVLQKPTRRSHLYNALVELLLDGVTNSHSEKTSIPTMDANFSATKPLRILLTEDILLNQKVALQMLSTYGYQADIANNGKEAVEALQKRPYDLVFMDVQMPEMDGLTATGKIRLNKKIQQPYIIAMTAHAMQGDREECLAAGMDDYIGKPIRKQDLAQAIQRCPQLEEKPPGIRERAAQLNQLLLLEVDQTEWLEEAELLPSTTAKESSLTGSVTTGTSETVVEAPLYTDADIEDFSILDHQILEGVSSETDFLIELCDSFLQDAPQRIDQLRQDLAIGKAPATRVSAHALKSLSACVGAMRLFQVCKVIEDLSKRDRLDSTSAHMQQVEAEYEKVKIAIEQYKKKSLSEESRS